MSATPSPSCVEEFQGLYGPFQVSELVIQRIWLKQAFETSRLVDSQGRAIRVDYPGDWNRLEGPDSLNAVLRIGEERFQGDVEIHFNVGDWKAHGHDRDTRYDKVVLHVLYHLPREGARAATTSQGIEIPSVSLMPLLWYDLEEYAEQDSIVASTGTGQESWMDDLLALSGSERCEVLLEGARERWDLKCSFARLRIERLGWSAACHQTALEIMGFRHNRIPMLRVAGTAKLADFEKRDFNRDALWELYEASWRLTGCRPANHPRLRLEQYSNWCLSRPNWPDRLEAFSSAFRDVSKLDLTDVSAIRRGIAVNKLREEFSSLIVGNEVSGAKLDTLICDGFLPLLAAKTSFDYFAAWFAWFVGNVPDSCRDSLKRLHVRKESGSPTSNGWAQGILKLMLK